MIKGLVIKTKEWENILLPFASILSKNGEKAGTLLKSKIQQWKDQCENHRE